MRKSMEQREKAFLIGLERLTRETGIEIAGCGCCSSPYLKEATITADRSGYGYGNYDKLKWLDPSDKDDWSLFASTIVKLESE